jgi:2-amino-4-hydroxy-6-hydroxymethyldihydropteridine diphosphokinase
MDDNRAIISIGSNIDPYRNFMKAMQLIRDRFELIAVSSFQSTKPIGIENQPDFLNGALLIETPLEMNNVTSILKSIEDQMGRDRTAPKFGPRVIDFDVVIWNGNVVDDDYNSRDFLREAVNELQEFC